VEQAERLEAITQGVAAMDKAGVIAGVEAALAEGVVPMAVVQAGLAPGMQRIGKRFAAGECFVPEVLLASKALYAGLALVEPLLPPAAASSEVRVLLGVVAGDVHDIGKNIVKLMLSTSGFSVVDLGKNVKAERFLEAIEAHEPQVVGISTLMSPTIKTVERTIRTIRDAGLAEDLTIVVGGAPLNVELAEQIGADLYARDADEAVRALSARYALPVES